MITGYFGVPGCGKTTILTILAQKELKKIRKGNSPYKHVVTNFYCSGCEKFSVNDLGLYKFTDSLILIDEITLDVDSRDFKKFSKGLKDFFVLHRHLHNDIVYFCQDFERVDKTIRDMTFDLWYLKKSVVPLFSGFTVAKRIFRNININEMSSELTLGYRFASLLEIIFSHTKKLFYRKPYYKYFDSFDEGVIGERQEFDYIEW
ncbi:MAG: hypothetical protein J1E34_03345 [Oscillospiraceae bacterium]|nr:hypothetical protein [Oscillospiraceae bacterium]